MELLKLSDVRKELPFKTHQVNLWWSAWDLKNRASEIDYDVYLPSISMNLQRPFCWTLEQKQQLILSIIRGIYIPKICVLVDTNGDTNSRRYEIIDGKQRLSAIVSFINGLFPLPTGHHYDDCEKDIKGILRSYSPVCEVAYFHDDEPISDDAKIQWFEMINFSGTPQDADHLNKLKGI